MYIKLAMYLFFYMALIVNGFEVCNIHYKGHWTGWALKATYGLMVGSKHHMTICHEIKCLRAVLSMTESSYINIPVPLTELSAD